MTDTKFDCHMQMLSAIFEELKAVRGLLEKKEQTPENDNHLSTNALQKLAIADGHNHASTFSNL